VASYLVMTFGAKGVGDHVSCTPFVRNLARNRPGSAIDVAVFSPVGAELFRHNPHVRTVHLVDMDYLKLGGPYGIGEKARYIGRFRRMRYDAVFVLGSKFRHAVFAFLTGSRERIGYKTYHREFLLTRSFLEPVEKNVAERFLDLLVHSGMRVFDPAIELVLTRAEGEAGTRILAAAGVSPGEPVLAMAPFAADRRRTWPVERFWDVADRYARRGWKVVVLGAANERRWMAENPPPSGANVIPLVGALGIRETAAVIRGSNLFLGNDSGLGHVAGAVGTRALILGYYVTRRWYPLSPSVRAIIRDDGCDSCDIAACAATGSGDGTLRCMRAISVEEVLEGLEGLERAGVG
jgi:ADP-heptose:LPS heptosyltransferase